MIKTVRTRQGLTLDWEERLSGFLQAAIVEPEREPAICESLIEYVQHLIRQDRQTYRQRATTAIFRLFGKERRKGEERC